VKVIIQNLATAKDSIAWSMTSNHLPGCHAKGLCTVKMPLKLHRKRRFYEVGVIIRHVFEHLNVVQLIIPPKVMDYHDLIFVFGFL